MKLFGKSGRLWYWAIMVHYKNFCRYGVKHQNNQSNNLYTNVSTTSLLVVYLGFTARLMSDFNRLVLLFLWWSFLSTSSPDSRPRRLRVSFCCAQFDKLKEQRKGTYSGTMTYSTAKAFTLSREMYVCICGECVIYIYKAM